MSDNWIIIIPQDPEFVPSKQAQESAILFFQELAPSADEIKVKLSDRIRFIDCGSNLDRIVCPDCAGELELEWWQDSMDEEYEKGFPLRPLSLPCCGSQRTLQELAYDWPQGFARFSLEAMNPSIPDLEEQDLNRFSSILGCKVLKILQHI